MKLILTLLLVLSTLSSPSFGESSNIRYLEQKEYRNMMIISRMCIGGYEFVTMCKNVGGDCSVTKNNNFELEQIISNEGGGISC